MPGPMTNNGGRRPAGTGAGVRDFRQVLNALAASRSSIATVFSDFCRVTACCLAMQAREDEYLDAIKGYSKHNLDQLAQAMGLLINEMESKPFEDVLGVYYTEQVAGPDRQRRGEFYTPRNVSVMMAKMNLEPETIRAEGKPVTVSDPCCGSGGMALTCAELMVPDVDLLRFTLQDINPVACDMAYINTTLWGIPAEVILGNALAVERRVRWGNVHWRRVGEDQWRRGLRMLDLMQEFSKPVEDRGGGVVSDTMTHSEDADTPASPHTQFGLFDPEP